MDEFRGGQLCGGRHGECGAYVSTVAVFMLYVAYVTCLDLSKRGSWLLYR